MLASIAHDQSLSRCQCLIIIVTSPLTGECVSVLTMPTTIKQALKKWEEATGKKGSESTEVKLIGVYPPIEKVE